ncbi:hypothetical protein [Brevundimonas sp.]|uniref:hypothetical protein n=1 Tax=Brevundimonas sp. TaxID=1871086 RepID=UPI003F711673
MAGALGAALIGLHGLGFRWDPLGLVERRLRSAEARTSVASADAAARRFEVESAAAQVRRLDELHQQTVAVVRTTARAATQARSAHDAETPLDPDRVARLAGHDRECAASLPPSAEPPRLTLPEAAATPCVLELLPAAPTLADLEVAYVERGARLVACENARASAVETLTAERALQDRWRGETDARRKPAIWPW